MRKTERCAQPRAARTDDDHTPNTGPTTTDGDSVGDPATSGDAGVQPTNSPRPSVLVRMLRYLFMAFPSGISRDMTDPPDACGAGAGWHREPYEGRQRQPTTFSTRQASSSVLGRGRAVTAWGGDVLPE